MTNIYDKQLPTKVCIKGEMRMYKKINLELAELESRLHRMKEIETLVASLQEKQAALTKEKDALKTRLHYERLEYEYATEKSVANFLSHLQGTLREKTEKELEEFLVIKTQYAAIESRVTDAWNEISNLLSEKKNYGDVNNEYKIAFERKLALVAKDDSLNAKQCIEIQKELQSCKDFQSEVKIIISLGNDVVKKIQATLKGTFVNRMVNNAGSGSGFSRIVTQSLSDITDEQMLAIRNQTLVDMLVSIRKFKQDLATTFVSEKYIIERVGNIDVSLENVILGLVYDMRFTLNYSHTIEAMKNMKLEFEQTIEVLTVYVESEESKQAMLTNKLIQAVNKIT